MPRIIVTTDTSERPDRDSVLLDELVQSIHLSTGHAASQLVERLAWAISDAEEAETTRSASPAAGERHRAVRSARPPGGRHSLAA